MEKKELWIEKGESNCILIDRAIYGFAGNLNIFYKINIKTGAIEIIGSLPDEGFDNYSLVSSLFRGHNDLLFIPYTAQKIYCFNMETKLWESISTHEKTQWGRYYNVCLWQEEYYVFPFVETEMLRIGRKDKKIVSRIDIKGQYKKITGHDYRYFSNSGCYMFQDKVYMMMRDVPLIAEYDLTLDRLSLYEIKGDSQIYVFLIGHEDKIYVLGNDGKVYLWDAVNHTTEKTIQLKLYGNENERFKHGIKHDKYLYLFKYVFSDEFVRIDPEEKQADVLSLKDLFLVDEPLIFLAMDEGKFYFSSSGHILYKIDFETKEVSTLPLILDHKKMQEFISLHLKEWDEKIEEPILEGSCVWTLENYIKKLIALNSDEQKKQQDDVGGKIYIGTSI